MLQLQPAPTLPFFFFPFLKSTMDYGVQFDVERSSFCNRSLDWKIASFCKVPGSCSSVASFNHCSELWVEVHSREFKHKCQAKRGVPWDLFKQMNFILF